MTAKTDYTANNVVLLPCENDSACVAYFKLDLAAYEYLSRKCELACTCYENDQEHFITTFRSDLFGVVEKRNIDVLEDGKLRLFEATLFDRVSIQRQYLETYRRMLVISRCHLKHGPYCNFQWMVSPQSYRMTEHMSWSWLNEVYPLSKRITEKVFS